MQALHFRPVDSVLIEEMLRPESSALGYAGLAEELLKKAEAKNGSLLLVGTTDGYEAEGILIPRYEQGSRDYIVLKLKSGYNIGIDAKRISSIVVSAKEGPEGAHGSPKEAFGERNNSAESEKKVLLLSTGGTIASKVDYRTGAVKPLISASDLYHAIPELRKIARITPEIVFSSLSENLGPKHWQILSETIVERTKNGEYSGVVVMVGTDTLGYISAALSFSLIGIKIPVVFVAAQRSSDRPSSDAALNVKAAIYFASNSPAGGIFVAMHENESDETVAIHRGSRVRKNHTSRRDAFESIDVPLYARIENEQIVRNHSPALYYDSKLEFDYALKTNFSSAVALVKFYPGQRPASLDFVQSDDIRGLIVEGTGLGHVSSDLVKKIADLVQDGIFVGMTSQCIWGHVDLNVYETGKDLLSAGVVPLSNMLSETALAKISWALGNFEANEIEQVMQRDISGETTSRIILRS